MTAAKDEDEEEDEDENEEEKVFKTMCQSILCSRLISEINT